MRSYRSAEADAVALPGFTFGLDVVILVGHLRLSKHLTLDEVHHSLQEHLTRQQVTISRREILYLFEAYCSLLRAASQPSEDPEFQAWRAQAEANGGVIISIDGIQPDKGNETLYLVRDVLTGRLLCAANVSSSETEVMKRLLAPVDQLGVPVLGVISDAQHTELLAVAQLWPNVPHQTCQFHYLREASQPIYEVDRSTRTAMRKTIGKRLKKTRNQLAYHLRKEHTGAQAKAEQEQLQVLSDYADGGSPPPSTSKALNRSSMQGLQPLMPWKRSKTAYCTWEKRGASQPDGASEAGAPQDAGWLTADVARAGD